MVLYGFSCSFFFELLEDLWLSKSSIISQINPTCHSKSTTLHLELMTVTDEGGQISISLFSTVLSDLVHKGKACAFIPGGGVQTFRLKGQNRNLTANTYRNMLHRVE